MKRFDLPLLGFCAWSGTGKTTLLSQLIPLLRERGLRLGVVKHAHHAFDIDHPGKDSWVLRHAGADQTLVASRRRTALIVEHADGPADPELAECLAMLDTGHLNLVLVEGFKHESFPKIELHRPAMRRPLLCGDSPDILAVASDRPVKLPRALPLLDLNDTPQIADFIIKLYNENPSRIAS
jgi:molybdopterin-guanine dinucleotide biosynthesis protein MobB